MFLTVGLLVTGAIFGLASRRVISWRSLFTVVGIAALILLALAGGVMTRGGTLWWQQPLWRNLLLYCAMFTGMMFRVIWDQLEAWRSRNAQPGVRRRRRPRFDFWEFVYPVMPSLALFQAVLWLAGPNDLNFQLVLASFQNGFFWHALLVKTEQSVERTGVKP